MAINKEKFDVFKEIKEQGETNMFDVGKVMSLQLEYYGMEIMTKLDYLDIMRNFDKYEEKFNQ